MNKLLTSLLAGILLPFCFAPARWPILSFIVFPLLYLAWRDLAPKQAFFSGWLFGLGFFAVGVSWVFVSIHEHGNTIAPVAAVFTALFIALLALFPATLAASLNKLFPQDSAHKWLLVFPTLWVLFEWLRSHFLTGFPWLLLGYSQVDTPLASWLPVLGIYGSGALALFFSMLPVVFLRSMRQANKNSSIYTYLFIGLGLILLTYPLKQISWTQPQQDSYRLSLVQGNIPQPMKWSADYLHYSLERYQQLTEQHWQSDLIVWPETAVPVSYHQVLPFIEELAQQAREQDTHLLLGVPVLADNGQGYYNSLVMEGPQRARYNKQHLVPFGEYLPLDNWLRGLIQLFDIPMSQFVAGERQQAPLQAGKLTIAPFICYEIAYTNTVKRNVNQADVLLTINNMAWFGDSLAPGQHLQMARAIARMSGRYHAYVSNDGVTAIIKPNGQLQEHLPQFESGVLTGHIQPMHGQSPWMRWGDMPVMVFLLLLVIGVGVWQRHEPKNLRRYL